MNKIKGFIFLVVVLSLTGCASVNANLYQNTIDENYNIGPDELKATFKQAPFIDQTINSFRYQVYNVGAWIGGVGSNQAVYFKDGKMVAQAPYTDKYSNLKMLLQLGAVSQEEYNKNYAQYQHDDVIANQEQIIQQQQILQQQQQIQVQQQQDEQDKEEKEHAEEAQKQEDQNLQNQIALRQAYDSQHNAGLITANQEDDLIKKSSSALGI
jgi:hypothetical protein